MPDETDDERIARDQTEAAAEEKAKAKSKPAGLFARVHLVHAGRIYEPGDSIAHLDEHVQKHVIDAGHASASKPRA